MEIWVLRIVHLSTGILWVGFATFAGVLLIPAVQEAGPAGGAVLGVLGRRKMSPIIAALSGLCVLSGLRLYAIYYSGDWLKTSTGMLLSLGALAALISFIMGMIVTKPTLEKLSALMDAIKAAGGPPSAAQAAQAAALGDRMAKAAKINAGLLVLAALCMAASRFAPQL